MSTRGIRYPHRAAAAQSLAGRYNWQSAGRHQEDWYRVCCREELRTYFEFFQECPQLKSIHLSSGSEVQRESGEVYLIFSVKAKLLLDIEGVEFQCGLPDLKLTEREVEQVRRAGPHIDPARIKQVFDQVTEMTESWQYEDQHRSGEAFWGMHSDLEIHRGDLMEALSCDPFDEYRAMVAVLEWLDPLDLDFTRAPYCWSPVTLSKLQHYLAAGVSPDACDAFGTSALNAAVAYGRHPWVYELVRAGADLEMADLTGLNPVSSAVARNDDGLLEVLVKAGASPDGAKFAPSLLLAAQSWGSEKLVGKLLALGASPDVSLPDGTRLSDDFSRVGDVKIERRLAATQLQRAIESAFGYDDDAPPAPSRSSSMTL